MGIDRLSDEQLNVFINDPTSFMKNKQNMNLIVGFDSAQKRRVADILKYEHGLPKATIKSRLDQAAMIRLKEVDILT